MRHLNLFLTIFVFACAFHSQATTNQTTNQIKVKRNNSKVVNTAKTKATNTQAHSTKTKSADTANNDVTIKMTRVSASTKKLVDSSNAPKITGTIASKPIKSSGPVSVVIASHQPTASTGYASCPYRNKSASPFSKDGKLTQVKRLLPNVKTAYETRSASGIN